MPSFSAMLGEALAREGRLAEALGVLHRSIDEIAVNLHASSMAELFRVLGGVERLRGNSTDAERLLVRLGEPPGEFPQVLGEGSAGVRTEIVVGQEAVDEGRFAVAGRHGVQIIIGGIFHGLFPGCRQVGDSECFGFHRY